MQSWSTMTFPIQTPVWILFFQWLVVESDIRSSDDLPSACLPESLSPVHQHWLRAAAADHPPEEKKVLEM